eukprot:TRINITY_DN4684_c0_g1_i1.p1 TRINITY_DN4684_c0_g1~~TRINITY_DN4684_c0_g1_i1.p1  ORF type:complete len:101 (+),score=9.68 TRINITY_DN4684_c0_g1_i1:36-338(+)
MLWQHCIAEQILVFSCRYRNSVPVLVSASLATSTVVGGHLESRDALEVHHLQHLLGLGINLDDILFQSGDVWDVVVPSLPHVLCVDTTAYSALIPLLTLR